MATPGAMTLADLQQRTWHLLREDQPESGARVMTLADLQNRTWHLLREDGPDTGYAIQVTGDFPQAVVTRDLNIAQGQFISQTGVTYVGSPLMVAQTDPPVIPAQYHMALVYRVLTDYWLRKQDPGQAKEYGDRYAEEVKRASRGQGNFSLTTLTRDLNIAIAEFISETGIAPDLTDMVSTYPVFGALDFPVPPGLVSLTRIEYTPYGQLTYELIGLSFSEFTNAIGSVITGVTGQPRIYRQPWAGLIRLQPQPGPASTTSAGAPQIGLVANVPADGSAAAAATFAAPFTSTPSSVQVTIVTATPGLYELSAQVSAISRTGFSVTVAGGAPGSTVSISYRAESLSSFAVPGTQSGFVPNVLADGTPVVVTLPTPYLAAITSVSAYLASALPGYLLSVQTSLPTATGFTVTVSGGPPGSTVAIAYSVQSPGNGDTITFYYSSLGTTLVNPTDVPGLPNQFHMAIVYRVLSDYWERKQDPGQADRYLKKFDRAVAKAKAYTFDTNRATQPSLAGGEYDDLSTLESGGIW